MALLHDRPAVGRACLQLVPPFEEEGEHVARVPAAVGRAAVPRRRRAHRRALEHTVDPLREHRRAPCLLRTRSDAVLALRLLAEYLADTILDGGAPPFDMANECDPQRFGGWATEAYVADKMAETYAHNNRVAYPFENRRAGRCALPPSPLYAPLRWCSRAAAAKLTGGATESAMHS